MLEMLFKTKISLAFGSHSIFLVLEWGNCGFIQRDQSTLGGGCKWTSQRLCTVAFTKIFHLFFFRPHPGLGPVLLGRINLNIITKNGICQAHLWAMLHNVTFPDGRITGHKQLHSHLSINPSGTSAPCSQAKFCATLGCLQLSQWLLQTSQNFLKTNRIFTQNPTKNKHISCKISKQGFLTWVLQVSG